jgi:hypothetical protein
VSDIDTVVVNSLKALDPEWPIREADIVDAFCHFRFVPYPDLAVHAFRAERNTPHESGPLVVFCISWMGN